MTDRPDPSVAVRGARAGGPDLIGLQRRQKFTSALPEPSRAASARFKHFSTNEKHMILELAGASRGLPLRGNR